MKSIYLNRGHERTILGTTIMTYRDDQKFQKNKEPTKKVWVKVDSQGENQVAVFGDQVEL